MNQNPLNNADIISIIGNRAGDDANGMVFFPLYMDSSVHTWDLETRPVSDYSSLDPYDYGSYVKQYVVCERGKFLFLFCRHV